jgi:hypothetical protein
VRFNGNFTDYFDVFHHSPSFLTDSVPFPLNQTEKN